MDDIIAADVEETEAKMMLANEVSDEGSGGCRLGYAVYPHRLCSDS
jgi:hypothetical protein